MGKRLGKQTIVFENKPIVKGFYSIVGEKEGLGNFGEYFDEVLNDDMCGEQSFEKAERKIFETAIKGAVGKAKLYENELDLIIGGDLLNQIVSSSFTARDLDIPFLGVYGACSTMAESLIVGSSIIDGNFFTNVACATGSHFSTAERQYRFPLELGNQRPPTSQWTITGSGCTILSTKGKGPRIVNATIGKVIDYGVMDVNNMGACMAPATADSFVAHFKDTNTSPEDYDLILTGDLGKLGSDIFLDLMEREGYKIGKNYNDCGQMMYDNNQKTFQGGSGAGCSATILNSYVFKKMMKGELKKVLFGATGALLSTLTSQQGESIPGICHIVQIEAKGEND